MRTISPPFGGASVAKLRKLYWDSCAWLGLLNEESGKHRELEIIFNGAKRGHFEIWTSALSLVEVNRFADELGQPKPLGDDQLALIAAVFEQPFVKIVPLDMEIGRRSRSLVRETPGLTKKLDAVHLASALRWNVDALHTYDNDDLLHLDGQFSCKDGRKLKICYPDELTDGELFNHARQQQ